MFHTIPRTVAISPDFQRRRALAIERARAAVQPDPLPGFAFVHRLTEEECLAQAAGKPATPVVARGLLALSLVLQEEASGVISDEKKAAVALAVKTAMLAHEAAPVRSHVIKEEGDAYLLVILYCWHTGLFVPDQRLFPFSFEEVMSAFSQQSKIDLSVVGATFSRVE